MSEEIIKDRMDWLIDAVATSTQNRMFLRGEPEYDDIAGESIMLNGKAAMEYVAKHYRSYISDLEDQIAAADNLSDAFDQYERVGGAQSSARLSLALAAYRRARGQDDTAH